MSSYRAQPEQPSTVGRAGPGRPVPGLRVDAWAAFAAALVVAEDLSASSR